MKKTKEKQNDSTLEESIAPNNICGHFSEEETVWNVLRLKPGQSIIIEAVDNSEYTISKDECDIYADVIRSKTYFWRPLSNYDGLNPNIPDRNKSKDKVTRKFNKLSK